MQIKIDYHSAEPLCSQVVLQIKRHWVTGQIRPGEKLPSVRELAAMLKINPTTASRIFSHLAKEGIVVQKPGLGVFVSDGVCPFSDEYIEADLSSQAESFLIEGLRYGLEYEAIVALLNKRYEDILKDRQKYRPSP